MKTIAIKLEYRGKEYISEYEKFNKHEEEELINFFEKAAKGELDYFSFKCGNIQQYFTKEVLKESILGLIYSNDG